MFPTVPKLVRTWIILLLPSVSQSVLLSQIFSDFSTNIFNHSAQTRIIMYIRYAAIKQYFKRIAIYIYENRGFGRHCILITLNDIAFNLFFYQFMHYCCKVVFHSSFIIINYIWLVCSFVERTNRRTCPN